MKHRTRIALLSAFIISLTAIGSFAALQSESRQGQISNITYKSVDAKDLSLDIYLPESQTGKVPVVVFIHGGSWIRGDKSVIGKLYFKTLREEFRREGFAVVSINYRLSSPGGPHFPEPIVDCKDAVRWIRQNADQYNFDTNRIGLWGVSAGGHLAMMTAYSDDNAFKGDSELQKYSSAVNFVINNYGPTDLSELFDVRSGKEPVGYARHIVYSILGAHASSSVDERMQIFTNYSPVTNIKRKIPTLTFHGSADPMVPVNQAELLDAALKKEGVRSDLVIYQNEGHGFLTMGKEGKADLLKRSLEFAKTYSKTGSATALSR